MCAQHFAHPGRQRDRAVGCCRLGRPELDAAVRHELAFDARVAGLRELHRRRPSLIAMLDEAGFGFTA
jgi:hypothetical protein